MEIAEKLKSLMTDMKFGERLSFTDRPDGGVLVDVGGAVESTVEGDGTARGCAPVQGSADRTVRKEMRMTRTRGIGSRSKRNACSRISTAYRLISEAGSS